MADTPSFLGTGWSFPPIFDNIAKAVVMVRDEEDIQQSLAIILSTKLGERIMQPDFGCNLIDFVFGELDNSLLGEIEGEVTNALTQQEPRIDVDVIDINQDPNNLGLLLININYVVRSTNTRSNMVYPFYLNEATL
jgi:phage baseplate assembly protein W